ncbi:hypothetical protein [Comamonas sp.]|uniref:hypothetical protein n=1 Tax=Comamonas sp. TaxID=34028 RepID=UPI0012C94D97|nr:hypothetical protein [Comamonas sp.]MPS92731.1 hypothetical protein [Comamonas sp.]
MSEKQNTSSGFPFFSLLILITFLGYALLRLYFFLVPTPDTTLYFKKEACDLIEIIGGEKNDRCIMKGSVRQDLFTDGYLIKLDNGEEVYINSQAIVSRSFPVTK